MDECLGHLETALHAAILLHLDVNVGVPAALGIIDGVSKTS